MSVSFLQVRRLTEADAAVLGSWAEDELFCRHAGWTSSSPAKVCDFWIRQIKDPPTGLLRLAAESADREVLGYVDLDGTDPENRELGFLVGPSHRWGHGLGRRIAEAGLTYGFKELSLERIWAEAVAANTASVQILRALGMRETGRGDAETFLETDSHYLQFEILRDEWELRAER
jgi:RimJ/RimL family protein N-acetyltransferase